MNNFLYRRRRILSGVVAMSILPWPRFLLADTKQLPATPGEAEGPFYPVKIPTDSDNDLIRVMGKDTVSPGQLAYVRGTVMDRNGKAIDGARVEIWQCDNDGVYHHPGDPGKPDYRFQGFGVMATNRAGEYHFRTLRPVPYTGRTPHIHYRVTASGFDRLTTQLYVASESERNRKDGLYNRHSKTDRALITSSFNPIDGSDNGAVAAQFNIVLG